MQIRLGTIHLRRRQIFTSFDPYPLRRQFFTTICRQIWQVLDPFSLQNADVLDGWSPMQRDGEHDPFADGVRCKGNPPTRESRLMLEYTH